MSVTAGREFPSDMVHAAHPDQLGWLETATGDFVATVEDYVREKPVSSICWAVGIGFLLGWRLKPW